MGILVIDENAMDRDSVARFLQQAKYRVEIAADLKTGQAAFDRQDPHIVVIGWPRAEGTEFIKRIRAREAPGKHTYVLAVLDEQPATDIPALFAAGVDDFARRPLSREELLGRLEAPRRIQRWATQLSKESVDEWCLYSDPRRLRGCRNMGNIVAQDLAQMVGQPLEVAEGWAMGATEQLHGATISMTLANEQTEIRVSIFVDTGSLSPLGELLLGDPNPSADAVDDALRELANAAGGAVKREGLLEGITLTTGLPTNVGAPPPEGERTRFWFATMKDGGVRIGIVGEICAHETRKVPASDLREGMVLAGDLCNETGVLLVASGTRLTETTVDRLKSMLGKKKVFVDVACAA